MELILTDIHKRKRGGKTVEKITFTDYNDRLVYFYSNSCEL